MQSFKLVKSESTKAKLKMVKEALTFLRAKIVTSVPSAIDRPNLWLISERGVDARDNGYHLAKYIAENHSELDMVYVIGEDSPDYPKMHEFCETVQYGSWEHYKLLCQAKYLVSTHVMGYTPDAYLFKKLRKKFPWLFSEKQKHVFLQHGITKEDYVELKPENIDVDMFVCTTRDEYKMFLFNYEWSSDILKRIGMCRFDALTQKHKTKKQILVMPTWRRWLLHANDEEFKDSEYFFMYSSLITNESLIKYLSDNGYSLVFYLHHEFQGHSLLFEKEVEKLYEKCPELKGTVTVAKEEDYDVQALLKESAVLITDHSSVFFDFAYMHKPQAYFQFDQKKFDKIHAAPGYFSFQKDGFGPVCDNLVDIIAFIYGTVAKGCKVEPLYEMRIDRCFGHLEDCICEKTVQEIKRL